MDMQKSTADFSSFSQLDIRVGTVVSAEPANTNKPTFRMVIDFGEPIGTKRSCGAYTNYRPEALVGKQVIAVINFAPKRMGPEVSEALVLGVQEPSSLGTIPLTLDKPAPNGSVVF